MERARRRETAAFLAILLFAAWVRLACLRTQPWLDEIWSLQFARRARSLSDVLFAIHHDNSHTLNTVWLYLVSGSRDWAVFRYFSFACGLLTVAALGTDGADRPRGLLTAALAGVSITMVLYSTEARGYAPMLLCAVLCHRLFSSAAPLRPARTAAFALCATSGFFGHSTFVFVYAGLGAWALARIPRGERPRRLLALFGPAAAVLALYAALQTGRMEIGGGPLVSFWPIAGRTLTLWAGAPDTGVAAVVGAGALVALCGWELARLRLQRDAEFWFFSVLFAAAVAFVAIIPFRAERYFFAALPFALMLAARSLLRLLRGGGSQAIAGILLMGLFFVGNTVWIQALATAGRGHYLEAVQRMAAETPGDVITVGSDHPFRNPMLLDFYAPYLSPQKRIDYIPAERMKETPPDWFLRHTSETNPRLAATALTFPGTASYRLVQVYPYAGLSGWSWLLYRRTTVSRPPLI